MEKTSLLTLSKKVLIFLSLPLLFQIASMVFLFYLIDQTEEDALKADQAREMRETLKNFKNEALKMTAGAFAIVDGHLKYDEDFQKQVDSTLRHGRRLKKLMKGQSEYSMITDKTLYGLQGCADLAKQTVTHPEILVNHSEPRGKAFKRLRTYAKEIESLKSTSIGREISRREEERDADQARLRYWKLFCIIAAAVTYVLWFLMISVFFNKRLVQRLEVVRDNSLRIASLTELNPPIDGDKEIVELDSAFHSLADALLESSRKERAIIENARDVICSIDEKGVFIDVGDAVKPLLQYEPSELIGNRLINIVNDDDKSFALEKLQSTVDGANEAALELRLASKDGRAVDVLLSLTWSKKEGTIFGVAHDITERKQAQRLRKEVMEMVSHDLRGPLNSIRGVLEMLNEGMIGELNEQGKTFVARADISANLMLTLVNDLLDIEKLEAGMMQLNKSPVELIEVFEQVKQSAITAADRQRVQVKVVPTDIELEADQDRLVQILQNLVSNAIKFSRQDGTITVSACKLPGQVEIAVADQGRGIPSHLAASIFDRFKQVNQTDASVYGGTGLGLAICKALVELHDGDISVESQMGKGSVFSFRIPA